MSEDEGCHELDEIAPRVFRCRPAAPDDRWGPLPLRCWMAIAEQFAAGALSSLAAELDRLGLPKIAPFDSCNSASTDVTPEHFGAAHEQMLCALYGVACVSASAAGSQAETTSDPDGSSPSARAGGAPAGDPAAGW